MIIMHQLIFILLWMSDIIVLQCVLISYFSFLVNVYNKSKIKFSVEDDIPTHGGDF